MTIWNGKLMKENELSKPAKIIVGVGLLLLFASAAVIAARNVLRGEVGQPSAFAIMLIGFACFFFPKLLVIRKKQLVSFGARLMTQDQANFYSLGYYLMGLGFLFTFL